MKKEVYKSQNNFNIKNKKMKNLLLAVIIIGTTIACSQSEKGSTSSTATKADTTKAAVTVSTNNSSAVTTATSTSVGLPGPKKTGVNIDKYPQIMVDGTQVSTVEFKDDKGADITEKYYIQNANNTITFTQIQVMRGVATGVSKSIYLINTSGLNTASIVVEEINNKNYGNGKYYVVNIECKTGNNCMNHTYQDISVGKPIERMETLTQVSFADKAAAQNFVNSLKASIYK